VAFGSTAAPLTVRFETFDPIGAEAAEICGTRVVVAVHRCSSTFLRFAPAR
jgi:hypothetical protein